MFFLSYNFECIKLQCAVITYGLIELSSFHICLQKKDEAYFMTLLRIVESTPGLYYSYETDITLKYVDQQLVVVL